MTDNSMNAVADMAAHHPSLEKLHCEGEAVSERRNGGVGGA